MVHLTTGTKSAFTESDQHQQCQLQLEMEIIFRVTKAELRISVKEV